MEILQLRRFQAYFESIAPELAERNPLSANLPAVKIPGKLKHGQNQLPVLKIITGIGGHLPV